jgi:hypothetical protein
MNSYTNGIETVEAVRFVAGMNGFEIAAWCDGDVGWNAVGLMDRIIIPTPGGELIARSGYIVKREAGSFTTMSVSDFEETFSKVK